jgi:hypothetical protein
MASKQIHVRLAGALVIPLLLIVAACGMTPGANATPGAQATTNSSGTPTSSGALLQGPCGQFPQLQGAREGIEILNTDFPDSASAVVTTTSPASAPMQVVRYVACMQVLLKGTVGNVSVPVVSSTSSATVEVIEVLNLVNRGWMSSADFPFDGTQLQPCSAAQVCYVLDPQDYLELEQIADHGHGVLTFVLRVASSQPLVSCDPALFPIDYYPTSISVLANAEFPLPPVTRVSMGYGEAQGITTYFCTGGTPSSISAFMATHLPAAGWTPLTVNGVQIWRFPSGIGPVSMRINPILDPHKWSILTYNPGENLG